jgi:hypothetical protein
METDERSICTHVPQPQPSGVSHEPHDPEASQAQEAAAAARAIGKKTFRSSVCTPLSGCELAVDSGTHVTQICVSSVRFEHAFNAFQIFVGGDRKVQD